MWCGSGGATQSGAFARCAHPLDVTAVAAAEPAVATTATTIRHHKWSISLLALDGYGMRISKTYYKAGKVLQ
ncbi:hypothetical protein Tco_0794631 [Tanacetum coccineum]